MMIHILYNGTKILANNDGVPVSIPEYWKPPSTILDDIQAAFVDGHWEPIPDPELPPPEPDWTTFNATMLQNPDWQSWTALLPLQLVMGIVSASTLKHIEEVQSGLAIAYQISDPGPAFKAEWQSIADANHVPIIF